uniref:Probable Co/Zn/Cd efflux system membrane fusion protein n=1 Tax=uncultured Armatimonadetes bacterium TaxID=157466 RepID=A0A6J4JW75_9BACT|nr:Probable Co/Zn/Cd efflux system membrane fusion protein [uncultured Armatimonadetes bacterium]
MNKRKIILLALGVLFVLGLGGWALTRGSGAQEVTYRTAEVERQDLRETVSATGIVQPLTTVDIKSRAGGEVKLLAVEVGTIVKPGDLIARIDPTDSQTAYNQAQSDVSAARARVGQARDTLALQRLTVASAIVEAEAAVQAARSRLRQAQRQAQAQPTLTQAAIRQAQAGLRRAEQNLNQLRRAGDPQARSEARTALASAEASLKNAEVNLRRQQQLLDKGFVSEATVDAARTERDVALANAQAARTRAQTIGASQNAQIAAAEAQVNEARENLRTAQTQRVQDEIRRGDVANARAALAQAESTLGAARANAAQINIRAGDIETARAQIARSEAQFQNAQVQLNSTTIRAPRAGVVLQKYVEQGTIITSGQSFNSEGTSIVQLGDLSRVFVDAAVDEADIARVAVGQNVTVTLDAYPDEEFQGRVRRIDPRGTTDQNVTTIKTQVEILKPDKRLRPGLNSECEFIVAEKKNAIVVPSRAVKDQRGKKTVEVLVGGKPQAREVRTGLETNDQVEIVSGLEEGEKVVTQTIRPGEQGGGPGGGRRGGGGGPGGQGGGPGGGGARGQGGPGGLGGGGGFGGR